jgi:hypothetical protein
LPKSTVNADKQKVIAAEAKLFRAWSYKQLVYLFGGVPLILDEIVTPKADFVRASKDDILKQIVLDATDAAANLPAVTAAVDGKLNKAVANHLLAETYISLKDYDKAIAAATEVIQNSSLSLMNARFGSLKAQAGDVFYDLFRVGNQNRKSGNTESIWVIQYELDVIGGVLTSAGSPLNQQERCIAPAGFMDDVALATLKSIAGPTCHDMYMIRLPETYFLRAEANLLKGNTQAAADDLNAVRNRAKAVPVTPAQVTLDYILDERARELIFEEDRRVTLCRMGKLVERVKKYNNLNKGNIQDFHALFPIPASEIEANKDAVLTQNPGY